MAVCWQNFQHFILRIFMDIFWIENPQLLRILHTSNKLEYITCFLFLGPPMVLASSTFCSWMYPHYYWQMVPLSISWALLPSPSPILGHIQRRRSYRKEGSVTFHVSMTVTFHVSMTAEARSLSQKETQERYLK